MDTTTGMQRRMKIWLQPSAVAAAQAQGEQQGTRKRTTTIQRQPDAGPFEAVHILLTPPEALSGWIPDKRLQVTLVHVAVCCSLV